MADLAQLDLHTKGGEARVRALLEDLIEQYKGAYSRQPLALAVWFSKSPGRDRHNLLLLFANSPILDRIAGPEEQSLVWRASGGPPFASIYTGSVKYFAELLASPRDEAAKFWDGSEVLYFEKRLLPPEVLQAFKVVTEPPGLLKGWYVDPDEYVKRATVQRLLSAYGGFRPYVGLVKVDESSDFQYCRGLLHTEISQRWLPYVSLGGLEHTQLYTDWRAERPGYLLFEGGALYRVLKFELKTAPEYSARVLEGSRDGRYVEVYLRAVYPSEQSAA